MLKSKLKKFEQYQWWLGVLLTFAITIVSYKIVEIEFINKYFGGALSVAIILGITIGNSFFSQIEPHCQSGVEYAQSKLLKYGIILYGFRVTFQEIAQIGWYAALIDITIVIMVFFAYFLIATRLFKIDIKTATVISVASSICGSAAAIATKPIIRAQAYKLAIAIGIVVVFGTISIFLYPVIASFLEMSNEQYGVFVGSSVYGVSQSVAVASGYGTNAVQTAVVVKMFKVMMLIPMLIILSISFRQAETKEKGLVAIWKAIPWFAVMFIASSALNSLEIIPNYAIKNINNLSSIFLTMSMAGAGLTTNLGEVKKAGLKPLMSSLILYIFLIALSASLAICLIK